MIPSNDFDQPPPGHILSHSRVTICAALRLEKCERLRAQGIRRNFDASKHSSSNKADSLSAMLPPRYLFFSLLVRSSRRKRLGSLLRSALCVPSHKFPSLIIFSIFLGFICGSHRNVSHSYFRSVSLAPDERRTEDACAQRFSFELRRPTRPGDTQSTERARCSLLLTDIGLLFGKRLDASVSRRTFQWDRSAVGRHRALQQDGDRVSV